LSGGVVGRVLALEGGDVLMLCRDLGYIAGEVTEPLLVEAEISRMLYALRGKVEQGGPAE